MTHWVDEYLGKPWEREYDCYAHVAEVQREVFAYEEPSLLEDIPEVCDYAGAVEFTKNNEQWQALWKEVEAPLEGDIVVFTKGSQSFHIGVWAAVDGGGVLHCVQGHGVIFTPRRSFRRLGLTSAKYYRRRTS